MAIYVRKNICMSHLDPVGGQILANRQAKRLKQWLQWCEDEGQSVQFWTLTYDRKAYDCYGPDAAEAIYDDARDNKHLSRFMRDAGAIVGHSLKGFWIAKSEFQEGGFLHFHILVRGVEFVPHRQLQTAWGRGHVWVEKAKRRHAPYLAKYQAKIGGYPDWLYDKPVRSVKIYGTSPGFWKVVEDELDDDTQARNNVMARCRSFHGFDSSLVVVPMGSPRTIRESMEAAYDTVTITDDDGSRFACGVDLGTLVTTFVNMRNPICGTSRGSIVFDMSLHDAEILAGMAERDLRAGLAESRLVALAALYDDYEEERGEGVTPQASPLPPPSLDHISSS